MIKYYVNHVKIYIFIVLSSVLFCSGCSLSKTEDGGSFHIYYFNKDETTVVERPYSPESTNTEELIEECIAKLSTQPMEVDVKNPIQDTEVNDIMVSEEGVVNIDFDSGYFQAERIKETLRRAAIIRTLCQIDGVFGVRFSVDGTELLDDKLEPVGIMTADMFINNEGEQINTYEKATITLYFADESGEGLLKTAENVAYSSNIAMERIVLEQLIRGPLTEGRYYPVVPPNVSILSMTTKDGTCYVNLSGGFLQKYGNVTDETVLYSIVNSLTELSNINKVQFMIDGETEISFGEHSYLNTPLERNLDIVL
ncbi:MAG: GerMN domain-containing protein [Lachnospiraceae bacterium]|nr:GerMN domain-containing protein [Lachnospiraceae bacterium]